MTKRHCSHWNRTSFESMRTQLVVFGYGPNPCGVKTPFGKQHYIKILYSLTASMPLFSPSFGGYCRTCSWDTFEPQCGTAHLTLHHSHCKESRPSCFDKALALGWMQFPCQISPTPSTCHRQILSRGGKHTDNALA